MYVFAYYTGFITIFYSDINLLKNIFLWVFDLIFGLIGSRRCSTSPRLYNIVKNLWSYSPLRVVTSTVPIKWKSQYQYYDIQYILIVMVITVQAVKPHSGSLEKKETFHFFFTFIGHNEIVKIKRWKRAWRVVQNTKWQHRTAQAKPPKVSTE